MWRAGDVQRRNSKLKLSLDIRTTRAPGNASRSCATLFMRIGPTISSNNRMGLGWQYLDG
jgi:hypothetical protein